MTTIKIYGDEKTLELMKSGQKRLLWCGIFLLCMGLAAILFPITATFVTEFFIGWILVFAGVFHLLISFTYRRAESFAGAVVVNLITIACGLFLLIYPATAAVVLTLLITFIFLIQGGVTVFTAMLIRPFYSWRWLLVSGIASILLGLLIGLGLPGTSQVFLGFLVGINLIISGFACVMIARAINAMKKVDTYF